MKKREKVDYFVGLDIGTNSIGYAATTEGYKLIKHQQQPIWGVHLFESANQSAERRAFRTARRRLDRRQQRIQLLRELFAPEIAKIDQLFFQRIDHSWVKKNSDDVPFAIFADKNFTDKEYYAQYPTIHHLIVALIQPQENYDVRLVYLACAWLLAHRGHFLSDIDRERIDELNDFSAVYDELKNLLSEQDISVPWSDEHCETIGNILKESNKSRKDKHKDLTAKLNVEKNKSEESPINWDLFLKLLCGLEVELGKLFGKNYASKLSLNDDSDKIAEVLATLDDDDVAVLQAMKKVFDWSVLTNIIGGYKYISQAKVAAYDKHKKDLQLLKKLFKTYLKNDYNQFFRECKTDNYVLYSGRCKNKKINQEIFYKCLKEKLKAIEKNIPADNTADIEYLNNIRKDIDSETFLPKQVNTDNRSIPYQVYYHELKQLLISASNKLPFLLDKDKDNLSVMDKILSIMEFRVPYFVGPLNSHSPFAWLKRKAEGKILPWNIKDKVDFDASETEFISRMLNTCTYLPGEKVLAKQSLLYQKFEVLNLINTIAIKGNLIDTECKLKIFELFLNNKKMSKDKIWKFLKSDNLIDKDVKKEDITGIDDTFAVTLDSWIFFSDFINNGKLSESQIEDIIQKRTITEDKSRFVLYLQKEFPNLKPVDIEKIAGKKFTGFGRLSRKLLTGILCMDPLSGTEKSIINMMWDNNLNLQQLLSHKYDYSKLIADSRKSYYADNPKSLRERLDEMYISNAVKRPIIRTMAVLNDIIKTVGYPPKKIFVEMARDVTDGKPRPRTVSRFAQIQELYSKINNEDTIRWFNKELEKYENPESALQRDTLYLYFMQLGKCMYSGEPITDFSTCNKEHIYPQAKVKDDSIVNNIVLIDTNINGQKSDTYPISSDIRGKMSNFWKSLLNNGMISSEKYARLTRTTRFSEDEEWGFINRQLVETRQSTKAITELLKEKYPDSEIVYVKAGLVSDFRHQYLLTKSRTVNDLHHGKDAYLNIIVGNVYHSVFTQAWYRQNKNNYSIKIATLFNNPRTDIYGKNIWCGEDDIQAVKKTIKTNFLHLTNYTFCKHGGLFDQNPLSAGNGQTQLKKDRPIDTYGGYNNVASSFFVLALLSIKKEKTVKKELTLVPVDLLIAPRFLTDPDFAVDYVKNFPTSPKDKDMIISFPLGRKPIKIKTVFEVDNGLRFRLNCKASGGNIIEVAMATPLLLDYDWECYVKKLESFCDKKAQNPNLVYSEKYDKISSAENIKLYDILTQKLEKGIFAKRPGNPVDKLKMLRESFVQTDDILKQSKFLLNLIASFGQNSSAGINFKDIDLDIESKAPKNGGKTTLNAKLSNWKKLFSSVRIIYSDAAGLHEQKSENLLDFLK